MATAADVTAGRLLSARQGYAGTLSSTKAGNHRLIGNLWMRPDERAGCGKPFPRRRRRPRHSVREEAVDLSGIVVGGETAQVFGVVEDLGEVTLEATGELTRQVGRVVATAAGGRSPRTRPAARWAP